MKIAMIEKVGDNKAYVDEQQTKLRAMGHDLVRHQEDYNFDVITHDLHDADALIIDHMPLPKVSIEKTERLKFIDVASANTDDIPFDITSSRDIVVSAVPQDEATDDLATLKVAFDNLYAWLNGAPTNVVTGK